MEHLDLPPVSSILSAAESEKSCQRMDTSPPSPKVADRNHQCSWTPPRPRRAHLVGVAGNGMRAMADVLAGWGWQLSGSDLNLASMQGFAAAGVRLFQGHSAEHLPNETELVIFSDAVPAENPELRRAVELGIPALSYFQMLGRFSADGHVVAVAGTHGKSTTTAMAAHVLVEAGLDPTVFCGATPLGAASGGHAGGLPRSRHTPCAVRGAFNTNRTSGQRHTECACYDPLMLIEACEYRANFLHLRPRHAAILGIEPDHFDCFQSLAQLEQAFRQFAASVPQDGFLLVRHDCASTRRATAGLPCRVESFGLCDADWSAEGLTQNQGRFAFEIRRVGRPLCAVWLQVPGQHNVLNALAAAALCWENGVTAEQIGAGLESFAGLHRRLELLGTWRGCQLGERLCPSPHGGDGRVGRGARHVSPLAGVVRLPAASGIPHGPIAGRIGSQFAECRPGVGGRDISGKRERSSAGGSDRRRSRLPGRLARRRGLAGPRRRRNRPNPGNPPCPRRRTGYARGGRRVQAAAGPERRGKWRMSKFK